jgi:hypothetical protein
MTIRKIDSRRGAEAQRILMQEENLPLERRAGEGL